MENDVAEFRTGGVLETEAHPAMGFVVPAEAAGCDGVCKNKESPIVIGCCPQPLDQEFLLVAKHGLQTLAADIPARGTVDGIAKGHVICRHGFRHCSSSSTC